MSKKRWTKIYERTHSPSFVGYCELDLSSNPVILKPGQVKGMYIHSTLRGDAAIVYDNKEKPKTHDDSFITILPGRAHVSQRIFGSIPVWGWGSAWRDNREFVGQIKYGACYKLWNPSENLSFGENFRSTARTLLMCQRRLECPFSRLPDDAIYYILNMMRWDWVNDKSIDMALEQRHIRRHRRRQMIVEFESASRLVSDEFIAGVPPLPHPPPPANDDPDDDAVLGVDEDREEDDGGTVDNDVGVNNDNMEEDSADDSDADTGSFESAVSDEYAWGDHVSSRNAFVYNEDSSHSDESEDNGGGGAGRARTRGQQGVLRARRSILSFLRSH